MQTRGCGPGGSDISGKDSFSPGSDCKSLLIILHVNKEIGSYTTEDSLDRELVSLGGYYKNPFKIIANN